MVIGYVGWAVREKLISRFNFENCPTFILYYTTLYKYYAILHYTYRITKFLCELPTPDEEDMRPFLNLAAGIG